MHALSISSLSIKKTCTQDSNFNQVNQVNNFTASSEILLTNTGFFFNIISVVVTTKPAELGERKKYDEIKVIRHGEIALTFSTVKSIKSAKIFC